MCMRMCRSGEEEQLALKVMKKPGSDEGGVLWPH